MTTKTKFRAIEALHKERLEAALRQHIPSHEQIPNELHQALSYVIEGQGKRIRPLLVYATATALGYEPSSADTAACALEYIHTYSLVHDDLPAMDDDALRRGRPTCHVAFDEATAILVGDALQALAFEILATDYQEHPHCPQIIKCLTKAAGACGMVGGQVLDIQTNYQPTSTSLIRLHNMKTGALIQASLELGGLLAPKVRPSQMEALTYFGQQIGLAFQIQDDILDIEGETEDLGKTKGKDHQLGKITFPSVMGLDGAKAELDRLTTEALTALTPFGEKASGLETIARYIIERDH